MATAKQLEEQYQGIRSGRESLTDVEKRLSDELGLNQKRDQLQDISKNILDTRKRLNNVGSDVINRGRELGGPVTEAQRNRLTTVFSQPILKALQGLTDSEGLTRVGMDDINKEIMRKLGILAQERAGEDADYIRRINAQYQDERDAANRALQQSMQQQPLDIFALLDALNNGNSPLSKVRQNMAERNKRNFASRRKEQDIAKARERAAAGSQSSSGGGLLNLLSNLF